LNLERNYKNGQNKIWWETKAKGKFTFHLNCMQSKLLQSKNFCCISNFQGWPRLQCEPQGMEHRMNGISLNSWFFFHLSFISCDSNCSFILDGRRLLSRCDLVTHPDSDSVNFQPSKINRVKDESFSMVEDITISRWGWLIKFSSR